MTLFFAYKQMCKSEIYKTKKISWLWTIDKISYVRQKNKWQVHGNMQNI